MNLLILLESGTEDSFYLIIINKDANFLGAIQKMCDLIRNKNNKIKR